MRRAAALGQRPAARARGSMDAVTRSARAAALLAGFCVFSVSPGWFLAKSSADATPAVATAPPGPRSEVLDRSQAIADLLDWRRRVLDVHPNPFLRTDASTFDRALRNVVARLPGTLTVDEFFVEVAGLAALLQDSHTSVAAPHDGAAKAQLPLVVEAETLCFSAAVATVPAGACVEEIAGLTSSEMLFRCRRLVSAETRAGRDRLVPGRVAFVAAAHGHTASIPLVVRLPSGEQQRVVISPTAIEPTPQAALDVERIADRILMVRQRTMLVADPADFERAFAGIFGALAERDVRGLVIDFRDNDGGDTRVGGLLLSYLTERRHRLIARKEWKVSRLMQRFVRDESTGFDGYLRAPLGAVLRTEVPLARPQSQANRFTGPVVFLIGPGTLSAAMMTVDAVREYRLALVVGEPTSSPPNYFGETYRYSLPHSGLQATISTAAFVRASGDESDTTTVLPDVRVDDRLEDRLAGRDLAVQSAVRMIDHLHDHLHEQSETALNAAELLR
ncbi:MAG: S41 family peptidase [Myxococcota bacterium]